MCCFLLLVVYLCLFPNLLGEDIAKDTKSEVSCTNAEFACEDGSACVPILWRCDFSPDCPDGSDEPPNCHNEVDMSVLYAVTKEEINESLIPQFGPRLRFRNYLYEHIQVNNVKISPMYEQPSGSFARTVLMDSSASVSDFNSVAGPSRPPKRLKKLCDHVGTPVADLPLKDFIKQFNAECECIIQKHEGAQNSYMLREREQRLVVAAAIEYGRKVYASELLNYAAGVFDCLADDIISIFPMEMKETYYRKPISNSAGTQIKRSTGRLVEKYYNSGRLMNQFNKSPSQLKKLRNSTLSTSKANSIFVSLDLEDDNDVTIYEEDKTYLKFHHDPWNTVVEKWISTSKRRLHEIYKDSTTSNEVDHSRDRVEKYFEEWPLIQHSLGYTLLEIDFTTMYPDVHVNKFFVEWPKKKQQLKSLLQTQIQDKNAQRTLEPFFINSSVKGEDGMLLSFLAYLFKPRQLTPRVGSKAKPWRASTIESSKSFISLVPSVSEVQVNITKRKTRLLSLGETVQPYVVAVGPSMDKIEQCFVCMDNISYQKSNILEAVDCCFKCIHAAGCCYDRESHRVWLLLQLYYYEIQTIYDNDRPHDNTLTSVKNIIRKLKLHLENV